MLEGEFGIVANVCKPAGALRMGARVWLSGGSNGDGFERRTVIGLNVKGRQIEKWVSTQYLDNYRVAWIPPKMSDSIRDPRGSRAEMEELAAKLGNIVASRRP